MLEQKNQKFVEILTDLLSHDRIEGHSIRSTEILRVNSNGQAEVQVTKKAGKLMTNMIHDMDLLLKSKHVKSYTVSYKTDMIAVFIVDLVE